MPTLNYPHALLHDALRQRAQGQPDRVAIVFEDKSLTFADLDVESNRLAHGLRALGLRPGDRLGIFMTNCPEVEIAFYAASKLGAVGCPLNSAYREREVAYQLNSAGARMLITHAKLWPVIEEALPNIETALMIIVVGDDALDSPLNIISYSEVIEG
ncbi:MAG TPA: AMP-binding protein, partial [Blastocatellia bacterium]|nr:AMP-binding protein [Blastocatellia bacterium]